MDEVAHSFETFQKRNIFIPSAAGEIGEIKVLVILGSKSFTPSLSSIYLFFP